MRKTALPAWILCATVALTSVACDTTKMITAPSTAKMFKRASPALQSHWDYELAGEALPASIVQAEGILSVIPENETVLLQAIQANTFYAFGWIEDEMEQAEIEGDYERAEAARQRARLFYTRARDLARYWIKLDHGAFDDKRNQDADAFAEWVNETFDDEDDAEMLLWAGYTWGSVINMSKDDMGAVADVPYAKALVKRSVELDPEYLNAAGLVFLGSVEAQSMSGDLERSKEHFERALEVTGRNALMVQYNYAKTYAVKQQDEELYRKLLQEVIDAGDVMPEARLQNQIAKRRAERWLDNADMYFM